MIKKQYNIKGINGLYLTFVPDYNNITNINFRSKLIQDYNFYPNSGTNVQYKNAGVDSNKQIIGTNSTQKTRGNYTHSEIIKYNELVLFEKYYTEFDFYFRFYGCDIDDASFDNAYPDGVDINGCTLTAVDLYALRVYVYAEIGNNLQKLELCDLYKYNTITENYDIAITGTTYWNNDGIYLNEIDSAIDLGFPPKTGSTIDANFFNNYNQAPNGYNFKVKAKLDATNLPKALSTKTYKIVVKYVSLVDEIPLLSRNYIYKVKIDNIPQQSSIPAKKKFP